ncbi:J domain-containing protein [Fulvivirgaceae bacterium BMA10]|uniref:J domain-containing protein n=1 Tax=Splendidivirga corallicola TaxID=3051826 RepID=A0ABT8KQE9_9BACT|nr:J domain-containing protein [Fulvivirgaceae bacterium BMA10]
MQNHYLAILELQPGATRQEIKAAYRRLSKKHHPDISQDPRAKERFIEINEAYKFLTDVGPYPGNQTVSYDYNPQNDEYNTWRRKAREHAWRMAKEAERRQNELIKSLLRTFNIVASIIIIFNLLLSLDYLLPWKEHDEKILQIKMGYETVGRRLKVYKYDDVEFSNFKMRFVAREVIGLTQYEKAVVIATPIFRKPMSVKISAEGHINTHHQAFNIFQIFGYMIPLVFIVLIFYLFILKLLDHKLTLAIFMIFLFITQLYLFFLY